MITRFFIVSTGRTGTLSIAKSLNQIRGLKATHEALPAARDISSRRWDNDIDVTEAKHRTKQSLAQYDEERMTSPHALRRWAKKILYSMEGYKNKIFVDSNCLTWNMIDLIHEACEGQVAYIYVYRNAADTIKSMFNTPFYAAKDSVPWERRAKRGFIDITRPDYSDEDRMKNCEYGYKIRTEQIESSLKNIDARRQLHIDFARMTADGVEYERIVRFIAELSGLPLQQKSNLLWLHKSLG